MLTVRVTRCLLLLLAVFCVFVCSAPSKKDANNMVKNQVLEYRTFCYSCSSESVMCQRAVYDGQYLTSVPCKSVCFLRQENNVTYRGCFDGWLGGLVRNDYLGCKKQIYYGRQVEWCFCKDSLTRQGEPCNGAPRDTLADNTHAVYTGVQNYRGQAVDTNSINIKSHLTYNKAPEPKMAEVKNEIPEYEFINRASNHQEGPETLRMCKDKSDGSYHDPSDCNRYYLCSNGYSYRMRCPKGTQWNQVLGSCAFAFHMQYKCKTDSQTQNLMPYEAAYATKRPPSYIDNSIGAKITREDKKTDNYYHYY